MVYDTREVYREIDKKYRALSRAQHEASSLQHRLKECGLHAEAAVAAGLLAMVEKAMQPILEPYRNAVDAYEAAEKALEEQFPSEE
jgi:hypothetical protein